MEMSELTRIGKKAHEHNERFRSMFGFPKWRDLNTMEASEFRQWARKHYDPTKGEDGIFPEWHWIIQDECGRMLEEQKDA